MIAEYTAIAGAPEPSTPWPLVLSVALRADQFEARRHLTLLDAVTSAIGNALGGDAAQIDAARERLRKLAYPGQAAPDPFMPNIFATDGE